MNDPLCVMFFIVFIVLGYGYYYLMLQPFLPRRILEQVSEEIARISRRQ